MQPSVLPTRNVGRWRVRSRKAYCGCKTSLATKRTGTWLRRSSEPEQRSTPAKLAEPRRPRSVLQGRIYPAYKLLGRFGSERGKSELRTKRLQRSSSAETSSTV